MDAPAHQRVEDAGVLLVDGVFHPPHVPQVSYFLVHSTWGVLWDTNLSDHFFEKGGNDALSVVIIGFGNGGLYS